MIRHKNGFTLIEIIIVLTMFAIITAGIVGSLMSTFRAQTKVSLSNKVVQNGNWALSEIRKNVINAVSMNADCPTSPSIGTSMAFVSVNDGDMTTITCYPPDAAHPNGRIASESANNGVFDLISDEVTVKDCSRFVSCEPGSFNNVISNVNFNFVLSAGGSNPENPNYIEKSFSSKVSIRN
jgi:prepilin-type N-terminal cleavage/methylation domain-containing protein